MTKFLLFFIAISHAALGQVDPIFWNQEDIICKESTRAEELIHFGHSRNEFAYQTDMHYQVMNWMIDPAQDYIIGDITYHFKSLVPGLSQLILDLTNALQIDSIKRNDEVLEYVHGNDQLLRIDLGIVLNEGEYDSLRIWYQGNPPTNGFGSFVQSTHAGANIIWTLSEPYGVRDWWPAKQDLIDKIDSVDIFITTPFGNLAASNGKLMSITDDNGQLIHHWRHRYPIVAYLVALAVTNYADYSQYIPLPNGDSIHMLNYVYPESLDLAMMQTESSIDIMQYYNDRFGIYPFAEEKYGHAQFGWGGGEEHQTMSFMVNFDYGLQAHEMAHQWFGDKVTCGSWRDIWLNEGFATYMTGLTFEEFSNDLYWPLWKNSVSNSATSQPGGSVWVDDTTSVNRIFSGRLSYNKAAYLLHMMRWITGDSSFFRACRAYLNGPGTAFGFGRTSDLQAHFENETGISFQEFLDDWFYGQGWPSYHLRWMQQADSLVVWVGQDPSHPSVDFFEMPIPILVRADSILNIYRVDHAQDDQRFSFWVGNTVVDSVGFDPEKWILSRNNTVQEIITSVYDTDENDNIIMFPNPAARQLEVISPKPIDRAEIIDALGITSRLNRAYNKFDLSAYPTGLYNIVFFNADGKRIAVKRLMVIK